MVSVRDLGRYGPAADARLGGLEHVDALRGLVQRCIMKIRGSCHIVGESGG